MTISFYMEIDWLECLDNFLRVLHKELLTHAGKIRKEVAEKKAVSEFAKYKERAAGELSTVEKQFLESIEAKQREIERKK